MRGFAMAVVGAMLVAGCAAPTPDDAPSATSSSEADPMPPPSLDYTSDLQTLTPVVKPWMSGYLRFAYVGPSATFEVRLRDPLGNVLQPGEFGTVYNEWESNEAMMSYSTRTEDWFSYHTNHSVVMRFQLPDEAPEGEWYVDSVRHIESNVTVERFSGTRAFTLDDSFEPEFGLAWRSSSSQDNRYAEPVAEEVVHIAPRKYRADLTGACLQYGGAVLYCFGGTAPLGCWGALVVLVGNGSNAPGGPDPRCWEDRDEHEPLESEEPLVIQLNGTERRIQRYVDPVVLVDASGNVLAVGGAS